MPTELIYARQTTTSSMAAPPMTTCVWQGGLQTTTANMVDTTATRFPLLDLQEKKYVRVLLIHSTTTAA